MKCHIITKLIFYLAYVFLFSQVNTSKLNAQRSKDAIRVSNRDYMRFADSVDCDSIEGVSLVEKICLNIEFQRVDSILARRIDTYVSMSDDATERSQKLIYHDIWLENRNFHSASFAKYFDGHYRDIYYFELIILATRKRIEELETIFEIFWVKY